MSLKEKLRMFTIACQSKKRALLALDDAKANLAVSASELEIFALKSVGLSGAPDCEVEVTVEGKRIRIYPGSSRPNFEVEG